MNLNDKIRNEVRELFFDESSAFQREAEKNNREIESLFKNAYRNVAYLALEFRSETYEAIELYNRTFSIEERWQNELASQRDDIKRAFLNTLPYDKVKLDKIKEDVVLLEMSINILKRELKAIINKKNFTSND